MYFPLARSLSLDTLNIVFLSFYPIPHLSSWRTALSSHSFTQWVIKYAKTRPKKKTKTNFMCVGTLQPKSLATYPFISTNYSKHLNLYGKSPCRSCSQKMLLNRSPKFYRNQAGMLCEKVAPKSGTLCENGSLFRNFWRAVHGILLFHYLEAKGGNLMRGNVVGRCWHKTFWSISRCCCCCCEESVLIAQWHV